MGSRAKPLRFLAPNDDPSCQVTRGEVPRVDRAQRWVLRRAAANGIRAAGAEAAAENTEEEKPRKVEIERREKGATAEKSVAEAAGKGFDMMLIGIEKARTKDGERELPVRTYVHFSSRDQLSRVMKVLAPTLAFVIATDFLGLYVASFLLEIDKAKRDLEALYLDATSERKVREETAIAEAVTTRMAATASGAKSA